ncbi:MAG: hypothetical protein EBS95_10745, partial [Chitinophagia bacterium]|nr:hypothetical protein [Chitinophagia bacterium]
PVQQAQPTIVINNSQQQQQAAPAKTVIIKEKSEPVKQAEPAPKPKPLISWMLLIPSPSSN